MELYSPMNSVQCSHQLNRINLQTERRVYSISLCIKQRNRIFGIKPFVYFEVRRVMELIRTIFGLLTLYAWAEYYPGLVSKRDEYESSIVKSAIAQSMIITFEKSYRTPPFTSCRV